MKSDTAVFQEDRVFRIDDCYAAERSLAGSTAATSERSLAMLDSCYELFI